MSLAGTSVAVDRDVAVDHVDRALVVLVGDVERARRPRARRAT